MPPLSDSHDKSYRVGETNIRIKRRDRYLYRVVDSTGHSIDVLSTAKRHAAGAKRFFRKAFQWPGNPTPRVVNVDEIPASAVAVEGSKDQGVLPRRTRLRSCKYLNNIVEQDYRSVKKRVWFAKGYGSFQSASNAAGN